MNKHWMYTTLLMTAPNEVVDAPGTAAGEISENEVLPDTTEGNRGPSNTTRNNGDPTKEIHGNAGEVVENPAVDAPVIANSTNAITDMAYARLSPVNEVVIDMGREITSTYDVKPLFAELLGTDNVKPGAYNTAFRSINFRYPEAHGQRACIVYRDGKVRLLASGSTYSDWYGQSQKDDVAMCAIVYFDQRPTAENPFVSIRWYKKAELPATTTVVDDSL